MTCKDCVHHDLCFDSGTLFLHFTTTGRKMQNVETNCPFKNFKNKADFVEVVRCKVCKNRRETAHGSYCLPVYGLKQITDLNAYCSYGEREEKKDFKE